MNKIVFIFILSCLSLYGHDYLTYDDALKMQKTNQKIIMINVVRSDCHYCHDMEDNVFDNAEMSKWIDERFISVKIDLDIDIMPLDIRPGMTPTFYFINEKEEIIKTIPGSWNIEDFRELTKGIK